MISSVGVVVVNYNGHPFVGDCLVALGRTDWAGTCEVVVVDNASTDGSVHALSRFDSKVLANSTNEGFGAGCNRGMRSLAHCDAIALVNSDAFVEPDWLTRLVATLDARPLCGAVVPLTLFAGSWRRVVVSSEVFVPGPHDGRVLGVQVFDPATGQMLGADLHRPEDGFRWTSARRTTIYVAADLNALVVIAPTGAVIDGVSVAPSGSRQTVELSAPELVDVIDNAGVSLTTDWWSDEVLHVHPAAKGPPSTSSIEMWSGGAVLLRREFLDDVGFFDEPMFLYSEDVDLALRGRRLGWRYAIEPTAVVRHGHGWSTGGAANPLVRYCSERNRLVVIARHAPLTTVAKQWGRHVGAIALAARRRNNVEARLLARALAGAVRAVVRGPQPKWQKVKRPGRFHPGRSDITID
jgi:GT2 family glycosyltransferase